MNEHICDNVNASSSKIFYGETPLWDHLKVKTVSQQYQS